MHLPDDSLWLFNVRISGVYPRFPNDKLRRGTQNTDIASQSCGASDPPVQVPTGLSTPALNPVHTKQAGLNSIGGAHSRCPRGTQWQKTVRTTKKRFPVTDVLLRNF